MGYRERQAELMGESRRAERDIAIPHVVSPARRLRCEASDELFLKTYFGERFSDPWTPDRKRIMDEIAFRAKYGGDKALAAPRGEGKTSLGECRVGIKAIVTGELRFPLICAATGPIADDILRNIKLEYEHNDLLAEDYPEICAPVRALEGAPQRCGMQTVGNERTLMQWSGNRLIFPTVWLTWCPKCYRPEPRQIDGGFRCRHCDHEYQRYKSRSSGSILATRGLDAAIRGIRIGKQRPDFVLIDDPETAESARSITQIEQREKIIDNDIGGLGGPRKKIARLVLTTIATAQSLSARLTDKTVKPTFDGERMALVQRWPDAKGMWEQYIELRQQGMRDQDDKTGRIAHALYVANRVEMDRGVVVSNPWRFNEDPLPDGSVRELSTIQFVHNEAADKGWDYVFAELQNDPPDETLADEERLTAGKVKGTHREYGGRMAGVAREVVPDGTKCLTVTVDVQKRGLYYEVVAWFDERRRHIVDYGSFGDATLADRIGVAEAVRTNLRDFRQHLAANPYCDSNAAVAPNLVMVDSSYETAVVWACCLEFGLPWRAAMGDPHYRQPKERTVDKIPSRSGDRWYESRQRTNDGKMIWQINMDTDYWKHRCHDSWTVRPLPTEGVRAESAVTLCGEEPKEHAEFAEQIVAEEWREEFREGKGTTAKWVQVRRDNHYLDCDYMSLVAGSMCGVWRHAHAARMPKERIKLSELQRNKR